MEITSYLLLVQELRRGEFLDTDSDLILQKEAFKQILTNFYEKDSLFMTKTQEGKNLVFEVEVEFEDDEI